MKFDTVYLDLVEKYSDVLEEAVPNVFRVTNALVLSKIIARDFKALTTAAIDNRSDQKGQIAFLQTLRDPGDIVKTSKMRTLQAIYYSIPSGILDVNNIFNQLQAVGSPKPNKIEEVVNFLTGPSPRLDLVRRHLIAPSTSSIPGSNGSAPISMPPKAPKKAPLYKRVIQHPKVQYAYNQLQRSQPTITAR